MHESHFFFDAGAVLVAASVLLAIAAVAQTVWLHTCPAGRCDKAWRPTLIRLLELG